MYVTATAIFMAGIIGGTAWGIAYTDSVLHIAMAAVVGGFAGSAAGAVCFAVLYLFSAKEGDGPEKPVEKNPLSLAEPESERKLPGSSNDKRIKEIEKELKSLKKKRNKKNIS